MSRRTYCSARWSDGTMDNRPPRAAARGHNEGVQMLWKVIRLLGVAALAAATGGTAATDARADDSPACPSSTDNAYTMTTRALTDAHGTDVEFRFSAAPGCAAVDSLQKVQLKTYTEAGKLASVVNRNDNQVKATDGLAVVSLDRVDRGRKVEADVLVQTGTPARTYVLHGAMTSLLRPDLKVAVPARVQTLAGRSATVTATVTELNTDVGATAKVTLAPVAGTGETKDVTVGAGKTATVELP